MANKRRRVKSTALLEELVGSEVPLVTGFRIKNLTDTEVPLSVLKGSREVLVRLGPYKCLEVTTLTDSIRNLRDKKIVEIK